MVLPGLHSVIRKMPLIVLAITPEIIERRPFCFHCRCGPIFLFQTYVRRAAFYFGLSRGIQWSFESVETTKRPDVIVVLMESAFPTKLFPEIQAPGSIGKEFQSTDGRIRSLRVETFGGGTWITTASLMTSLPAVEFGWMREYLPIYLQDRMHHSLPKLLRGCGYRTAAISPLPYQFVNEGPFLRSLGIDDYYDARAIAAPTLQERNSFYFDAALKLVDQHRKTDPPPLLLS